MSSDSVVSDKVPVSPEASECLFPNVRESEAEQRIRVEEEVEAQRSR